jgi:methionyl-tRNA formyltransferase
MTYLFFGTPRFGALVLERLIAGGMPPVAVVTNPDRPVGRKGILTAPPVALIAQEAGIPLYQFERLDAEAIAVLAACSADCFVVAAYNKILKPDLLGIPSHGAIGVHPSLLPRHRGPAPLQQTLIDGLTETGVSLFLVDEAVDHGPVLATALYTVTDTETYLTLERELAERGATLLIDQLPRWVAGTVTPNEQDHTKAAHTYKFTSSDAFISWNDVAVALAGDPSQSLRINRLIAGLTPEPGVWTERDGKRLKLLGAHLDGDRLIIDSYQYAGGLVVHGHIA